MSLFLIAVLAITTPAPESRMPVPAGTCCCSAACTCLRGPVPRTACDCCKARITPAAGFRPVWLVQPDVFHVIGAGSSLPRPAVILPATRRNC